MGLRGLHEEERAQDVDLVRGVEVRDLDVRELVIVGYTGVVDDDVDLEGAVALEGGLDGGDERGGTGGGAEVGLGDTGADAVLRLEILGDGLSGSLGGGGSEAEGEVGALSR